MSKATYEQAQLQLQLFEQRREARIRQARDWFFRNYFPESAEDNMKIAPPGSENGTNVMMVLTYWEQACALLNNDLLHEDLFFETTGEFFGVFERVRGILPQIRQQWVDPTFLTNLEKVSQRFEAWKEKRAPGHITAMRQFMKQWRAQTAKAA